MSQPKKHRSPKKISQNYYLIALRAFLSYFSAKDIVLLPAGKIALPKTNKSEKSVKFLNLKQAEKPLFTNLKSQKDADKRLAPRPIEKIIKKYAVLPGVPVFTPPPFCARSGLKSSPGIFRP